MLGSRYERKKFGRGGGRGVGPASLKFQLDGASVTEIAPTDTPTLALSGNLPQALWGLPATLLLDGADSGLSVSAAALRAGSAIDISGLSSGQLVAQITNGGVTLTSPAVTLAEAVVAPDVPLSNTTPPEITGTTAVGNTLSASQGTWAGSAPRTYSYQWTRDEVDIPGADENTYTLVAADGGADVGCDVMADDGFTTVTASAAAVTVATSGPNGISITSTDGVASVSNYTPQVDGEITVTPDGGSPTTYTVTQAMVDDYDTAGAFLLKQPEASGTTDLGDTVTYGGEIIVHDSAVVVARTYETRRFDAVIETGPSRTITQDDIDFGVNFRAKVITGLDTIYSDTLAVVPVPVYAESPYPIRSMSLKSAPPPSPAAPITVAMAFTLVETGMLLRPGAEEFSFIIRYHSSGNVNVFFRNGSQQTLRYYDGAVTASVGDRIQILWSFRPSSDGVAADGRIVLAISVNDATPMLFEDTTTYVNTDQRDYTIGGFGNDLDMRLFYVEEVFTDVENDPTLFNVFYDEDGFLQSPALIALGGRSPYHHLRDDDFADGANRGSADDWTVGT